MEAKRIAIGRSILATIIVLLSIGWFIDRLAFEWTGRRRTAVDEYSTIDRLSAVHVSSKPSAEINPPLFLNPTEVTRGSAIQKPSPSQQHQTSLKDWLSEFDKLEEIYYNSWSKPYRWNTTVQQGDGLLVGWIDSPFAILAYLEMYNYGKDIKYLNRFVQRVHQLLAYRWDANKDGFLGWPSAQFSVSALPNGSFEKGPNGWGIGSSASVVYHEHDATSIRLFSDLDDKCSPYVSVEQGAKYLSLSSGAIVSTTSAIPLDRRFFQLRMNVKIPNDMQLRLLVTGLREQGEDVLLDHFVSTSADRGPEGWQLYSVDIDANDVTSLTLLLSAVGDTGAISVDNVALTTYEEYLSDDMAFATILARFAVMVQDQPELAMFSAESMEFQHVSEQLIEKWQPYWVDVGNDMAVYIAPNDTSLTWPGQTHPYNMMAFAGTAHLWLSELITPTTTIDNKAKAIKLANTLRHGVYPHPILADELIWNYRDPLLDTDPQFTTSVEDISHAGYTIRFVGELANRRLVFTEEEVEKISNALVESWNGNVISPTYTIDLGGSGNPVPESWGMFYHSHLLIGSYPDLIQAVEVAHEHFAQNRECKIQAANTGREMLVPALMIKYILQGSTNRVYLPLVARQYRNGT